jgi:RNA polymerase sigma factor (sigma-70 family)
MPITEEKRNTILTDKELIDKVLSTGNTALFGELYDRYANKVYRKCISMVKNKEDAKDLAHDILVKAFLNISKFAGSSSFSTWVYAITYNQCIDFLRIKQKKRIVEYENQYEGLDAIDDEEDIVEEKKIFEIEVERLQNLIHQLSDEDRMILLMKYQDEMSVEMIRQQLVLSTSAVKMRLKRARDRLRNLYQNTHGKRELL